MNKITLILLLALPACIGTTTAADAKCISEQTAIRRAKEHSAVRACLKVEGPSDEVTVDRTSAGFVVHLQKKYKCTKPPCITLHSTTLATVVVNCRGKVVRRSCGSDTSMTKGTKENPGELLLGQWGGKGARLTASSDKVEIALDCDSGAVGGPIRVDPTGRFKVNGHITPGIGIERALEPGEHRAPPRSREAVYSGTLTGNTLNLEITSPDHAPLQLTLYRGKEGSVALCY